MSDQENDLDENREVPADVHMDPLEGPPIDQDEQINDGRDELEEYSSDSSGIEEPEDESSDEEEPTQPELSSAPLAEEEQFEVDLPPLHQYLGDTTLLSGRTFIEDDDHLRIPILVDSTLQNVVLLPAQTIPLTIFSPMQISLFRKLIDQDRIFGILHTRLDGTGSHKLVDYGTTAEIYEFNFNENLNSLSIKAKGNKRFKVISIHRETTGVVVGQVKILKESHLRDPLVHRCLCAVQKTAVPNHVRNSEVAMEMRPLSSIYGRSTWHSRRKCSLLTPWPSWVYDQYDEEQLAIRLLNEIKRAFNFNQDRLKVPLDPVDLSHWAGMNLPLADTHRVKLLSLNTPTQRMRYILSIVSHTNKNHCLCCAQCYSSIAKPSDIFCMSSEGPQGTFVNPGGYVHEMITLMKSRGLNAIGRPSPEHSWFPGYAWTIIVCKRCHHHLGWRFSALKLRLKPQKFFGITRKSVTFREDKEEQPSEAPVYVI